jgi:hypothetical protein
MREMPRANERMKVVAKAATKKSSTITQEMVFNKSTKGTHVFAAKEDTAPVPTLYVRKTGMSGTPPDEITLTIEF